ncbi:hypothetical protein PFICI_13698 [Pestalotiopsis fici W106-1]|uniref:NmrA-like domain-containing protein n=1 Tax=Pestalotiopsis fici (strain W106-1 / CGMCC3.15140) TaxID=1229662 RepID=W3WN60_PESFW|nr:uncharacterized protein PFICI_13698 [Pestalotiopsis fici W106-1]ETS75214.1 hypothetical protein PFICI_13698 [Pestalotiopsis fici W106-1]
MFTGTILLLGGTGKVASEIAPLLHPTYPVLLASRSGTSPDPAKYAGVKFDWDDKQTWESTLSAGPTPVTSVWIVLPTALDPAPLVREFINLAREKGTLRFVLLSSSQLDEGVAAWGQVHQYLRELENFSTQDHHIKSIKDENKIYSATGSGKIPWVSTRDIAAVAHHALTDPQAPNSDSLVLGGQLYTYSDLAGIFSKVLGREIVYQELTEKELAARHYSFSVPEKYADVLASLDTNIKNGGEDRLNDVVLSVTGEEPRTFEDFVEKNKAVWQ